MYLTRFSSVEDFYRRAEPFLLQHEVECNVIIGLCTHMIKYPERVLEHPYMALVEAGHRILAVALRTPPYNLLLSVTDEEEALELIARDVYNVTRTLPGAMGPKGLAKEFADMWQKLSGQPYHLEVEERLFRLDKVTPVNGVSGRMRRATEDERDLLTAWVTAFIREALPSDPVNEDAIARQVTSGLEFQTRGYFLWDDGQPVALAGFTGPTPNSLRIGPVYTPPEFRRKGYASALVAQLSQMLLDEGRQFLTLYTDLSNPTSNHIYQEVGYYSVMDVDQFLFGVPDGASSG